MHFALKFALDTSILTALWFEKDATPYKSLRALRARRPPRSARVSLKSGVCLEVSEGVLQGSFEPRPKMCPIFKSLLEGPQGHFPRHFRAHRIFGDTLSDTPRGTSGPKGPKTPVGGRRVLNLWYWEFTHVTSRAFWLKMPCSRHGCSHPQHSLAWHWIYSPLMARPAVLESGIHYTRSGAFFLWKLASVLDSWALKPSRNLLRFPAMCPPKTAFCRKVHFSCRKMHFFCRKIHFPTGKPIFLHFALGGWESWMVVCFWMIF